MGKQAACKNDIISGQDQHLVQCPGPVSPVLSPFPFSGTLTENLVASVLINGQPAAIQGSIANNLPTHPIPVPCTFVRPPTNKGSIVTGSKRVKINGRLAARDEDKAQTCDDLNPQNQNGTVQTKPTARPVLIGD